jgi:hypothetical protein
MTPTKTITPTPSVTPFVPSQFTNLWDWWKSDTGVSTNSSQGVTGWTGYNGNVLSAHTATLAKYLSTDSLFNNQPVVEFNTGLTTNAGYVTPLSSSASSKTILFVGYIVNKNQTSTNQCPIVGMGSGNNPRTTLFGKSLNQWDTYSLGCGEVNAGTTFLTGYTFVRLSYNRTSGGIGYYKDSVNNFNTLIRQSPSSCDPANLNFTSGKFEIGHYNTAGYLNTPNMKVVEIVFINGIPTSQELTNYSNYLLNKYNI